MRLTTYFLVIVCFLVEYYVTPILGKSIKHHRTHLTGLGYRRTFENGQNIWELSGMYQGDIRFPPQSRNGIRAQRWPNKEMPYEISEGFTPANQDIIRKSLDYLSSVTCIKTRPRRLDDLGFIYISHESGHGCSSNIGYWETKQIMYLDQVRGCVHFGVVIHELLHNVGLWHQQSAHNRDKYLNIIWENVIDGLEHNFDKADGDTTSFGYKYDFNSIMHYSAFAFSKNGKATIVPKNASASIRMGQRSRMSTVDIAKVNTMYDCY